MINGVLKYDKQYQTNKHIKLAVILAAGKRKDLDCPAGLLTLDGKTLIKRNIEILEKNGIEKFIVVTGYKSELINRELCGSPNIKIVENSKYKWTGSMESLACAGGLISDDFLLIEEDILIEESGINQLIIHPSRDCVLITSESGSGDEAFVEIKNGYLNKISKDVHQLNKIDGEMVGISKISYEVFKRMLKEYRDFNENPYINYEYILLDVTRFYNISYLKFPDLVWAEMDTMNQYTQVKNKIFPLLKRKEKVFQECQIKNTITNIMDVLEDDINKIEPFGGMTNRNFKIGIKGEEYVLRIPGNGTEKIINRRDEKANTTLASHLGIDSELIYFNEFNGLKVTKLIPNAETLNPKTAKREDNLNLIALLLKRLHTSGELMKNEFNVFNKISEYEQILKEVNGKRYENYDIVRSQVLDLKSDYEKFHIPIVPCHNDLVPENLIKSGDDQMYLIDWEYGGMNDPLFDLAAISLECEFSIEDEELLLGLYLGDFHIPLEIKKRILMNKIFQDFLWSIWSCIKEAKGEDFGIYGLFRFNRARENLDNPLIKKELIDG